MRRVIVVSLLCTAFLAACGDDAPTDAGLTPRDSGSRDASPDAGSLDLGFPDLGVNEDAGFVDTGVESDAGFQDTGLTDSGELPDTGVEVDAGIQDTGPSCNDGIRNEDEEWVDCGGWCNNLCPACPNTGNLLRNPSFESVPGTSTGQGLLPNDWISLNQSPDTYSNDGSYGLPPSASNNFGGVVAQDGIRWVAGWNAANETFGQTMTSSLTPGVRYRLEGYLHRAIRADLTAHGTYVVSLADGVAFNQTTELGRFAYTSSVAWQPRMISFVAPPEASQGRLLYFVPTSTIGSTYPGLDNLLLIQTSSCTN